MENTWPDGTRRAMHQHEHEAWNAENYPGTRQLCSECDQPTGRCEDDTLYINDDEPLCEECWDMVSESNKTKGCGGMKAYECSLLTLCESALTLVQEIGGYPQFEADLVAAIEKDKTKNKSIKIVCGRCGSDDVRRDAWAEWDMESQKWVLGNVYDQGFCESCEDEVGLKELKQFG